MPRFTRRVLLSALAVGAAIALGASANPALATSPSRPNTTSVFSSGTATRNKPDDITRMDGSVYVTFQNGVGPTGTPGPNGNFSTIVRLGPTGAVTASWNLVGRCDGLRADPEHKRLIATINEDGNSSLSVIRPEAPPANQVTNYTYSPDPATTSGGGTDSVTLKGGKIYIAASNPSSASAPAMFEAELSGTTATLTPVFNDNSGATDAVTGAVGPLALTDPDSNTLVPKASPRFAGDIAQDAQGDNQIVFVHKPGRWDQSLTTLNLSTSVDDLAFATSSEGTLLVVDQGANNIVAVTGHFAKGTAFVAVPSGNGPAYLGTVDLSTGTVTPLPYTFTSPKGLQFIPEHTEDDHGEGNGS